MTPTIPRSFIRLSDGAYPIPAWHDPDPATHAEVYMEDPPEVPLGYRAVLADRPDAEHVLRYNVEPIPAEDLRAERLAELAAVRYQAETRGIEVAGLPVQTDRESRPNLIAAYAAAAAGLRAEGCVWKFADGVARAVSAETLMAMATAVLDHVQRCYDQEAVLAEIVRASDNPLALDLHTGWPGQSAPVPAQP